MVRSLRWILTKTRHKTVTSILQISKDVVQLLDTELSVVPLVSHTKMEATKQMKAALEVCLCDLQLEMKTIPLGDLGFLKTTSSQYL